MLKTKNPLLFGLYGTLGVGLGLIVWNMALELTTIFTYLCASLFIALGIDPIIRFLEKYKAPRPLALLITILVVLSTSTAIIAALIPKLLDQVISLVDSINRFIDTSYLKNSDGDITKLIEYIKENTEINNFINIDSLIKEFDKWISNPKNLAILGTGILEIGAGFVNILFGILIVIILSIYFIIYLKKIKNLSYRFVPYSKRANYIDISERITDSVGKYVIAQFSQALINGTLAYIFLSIIGVEYALLFAGISFIFALIPLVGTLSASIIISFTNFISGNDSTLIIIIYYLIYMQIEAYIISPRIIGKVVKVPALAVLVGALIGGTLLGVWGALIAIPITAAIIIIVKETIFPKIDKL